MTEVHTCIRASCGRPMRHDTALICAPCGALLRRHLEDVAKIAGDITITVAKLAKVTRGAGSVDDLGWWKEGDALEAIPLPVDLDAARRHDAAVMELETWLKVVERERGFDGLPSPEERLWPALSGGRFHPLATIAVCLIHNVEWLRHRPEADEAWPALLAACGELVRVVDTGHTPGDVTGLCSCGTTRHTTDRTCRRCGAEDLEHDRAALDAAMAEATVTASEAARWIADMGLVTDTGRLRKLIWAWADRGHISPVDDVPRYRFGDVLHRVMSSPALRVA